nr:hypothetical protein [Tanacetum cinerariifolium]
MRTKPGVDTLSFDDLYTNLRVFDSDVKCYTTSLSSTQNVAFVSSDNTNNTNEVSAAYGVSTSSGHNSQKEGSLSYINDLMYSFFANQSHSLQLDHDDLNQVDEFDLEEMDLKWQVAMISTRLKKFYKKTRRKLYFDAKELVGFDKTKVERDVGNTRHKVRDNGKRPAKQDEHKAMVTIDGEGVDWTGHAKDDTENYALMAFNSSNSGSDIEKLKKKKEELKTKHEIFQSSSKGLSKLLNSQMSAKDKSGLGYGNQIHKGALSYENEVLESVFNSRSSDVEDSPMNDRFAKYDFRIDESNVETLEYVPKPIESKPKAVSEPKVWSDAPIIEEYKSNSNDEYVFKALVELEKPSCAFINNVKHVKTPRKTIKDQDTCSKNPKVPKRDWTGLMSKRLGFGYGYTRKACFAVITD